MSEGHSSIRRIGNGLGFACVAAAFVLSLPGTEIARAGDEALMSHDPALAQQVAANAARAALVAPADEGACAAGSENPQAEMEARQREMMAQLMQRMQAERGGDRPEVIVLNGSGYNYAPDRRPPGAAPPAR